MEKNIDESADVSRKKILIRLLYTILFFVAFEIVTIIIYISAVFQYVYLLITKKRSEPIRIFSNKIASYTYSLIRYITLNESERPFPFSSLSPEIENPESDVKF